ncbi:uncharacterized protein K452DRAFT_282308 [Aplosporella prunicola CBS 121167]|uniref:Uncharacterized protein n=1 Tax=Aplosporella prunicola CBS 121167 TaxID=1176127 RepID=A0A6A6BU11_9PEZI|nr:uncharacterized protein K452DRAFT_282308 [Aplosporella prunicola CBS 121167]KAF2147308.1 hypothetical protein K452DRAFT_282308 [Aplosporella prunicola CBS 121167]
MPGASRWGAVSPLLLPLCIDTSQLQHRHRQQACAPECTSYGTLLANGIAKRLCLISSVFVVSDGPLEKGRE